MCNKDYDLKPCSYCLGNAVPGDTTKISDSIKEREREREREREIWVSLKVFVCAYWPLSQTGPIFQTARRRCQRFKKLERDWRKVVELWSPRSRATAISRCWRPSTSSFVLSLVPLLVCLEPQGIVFSPFLPFCRLCVIVCFLVLPATPFCLGPHLLRLKPLGF